MDRSLDDIISDNNAKRGPRNKGGRQNSSGKARSHKGREDRQSEAIPYHRTVQRSDNEDSDAGQAIVQPFHQKKQHNGGGKLVQPSGDHFNKKLPFQHPQGGSTTHAQTQHVTPALSIFERIGTHSQPAAVQQPSGTYVTIANLNHNVTIGDISELCSTVGEVKSVEMDLTTSSSQSKKKSCKVLFARRSDANVCVQKFHGLTLDGTKMQISLTGEGGKANPFNPLTEAELLQQQQNDPAVNKRAGFFGSALNDDEQEEGEHQEINFGYAKPRGGGGGGGGARALHEKPRTQQREHREPRGSFEHDDRSNSNHRGGRGGGRGGGGGGRGGGGRGGGGGNRERREKKEVTADDLDAAMDSYFANK